VEVVNLIKQGGCGKIVVNYLRVRNIARIVENKSATNTHDPPGKPLFSKAPTGHVHLVDTLVARLPVPGVPVEAAVIL
jgi:hypothetical protein